MLSDPSFFTYASVLLVALAGLPAGIFLSLHAFEELRSGNRYFPLLSKLLFVAAAAVPIAVGDYPVAMRAAGYGIILLIALLIPDSRVLYALLSLAFSLASKTQYFAVVVSLIFLYGLPAGAIIAAEKKRLFLQKDLGRILAQETVQHSGLLLALVLYFVL